MQRVFGGDGRRTRRTTDEQLLCPRTGPGEYPVVIVGAGMSGVAAAVRLLREGVQDFVLLEKAGTVGGTWRDNTYPGCGCDVPSSLYSYSFAPNPRWSRTYGKQREILGYLQDTAARFGVVPHIAFGTEATLAQWDVAQRRWVVETPRGRYVARVLIGASGPITEPTMPDVPGLETFQGDAFHSARWQHDIDLEGKRVAVIGNGASAVQFVPRIQPALGRLYLFQRTPQWVLPFTDVPVGKPMQAVFQHLPVTQRAHRAAVAAIFELVNVGLRHPEVMRRAESVARWHLRRQVADPELRAALTPTAILGCKRILSSNTWYPAITADNAVVVPHALAEVGPDYVVGADGVRREVDVIIFATGYDVAHPPILERIIGRHGQSIAETWAGSPQAYLGTTIAGFPNVFQMLGPNAISQTSCMDLVEAQLDYVIDALRQMRDEEIEVLEVRADVQATYQRSLQDALSGTVWNDGNCRSYYLDETGRNFASWPWTIAEFKRRLRWFDLASYEREYERTPA